MDFRSLGLSICILAGSAAAAVDSPQPLPQPRVAIAFEPGVNSLASLAGMTLSYHPSSRFAVDAGGGFGLTNLRYGLRGRVFLNPFWRDFHPFVGLFYCHAQGWGDDTLSMNMTVTRNGESREYDFGMVIDPSDYLGAQIGFEMRFGHVLIRPGFGWAVSLGGRNWRAVEGDAPTGKDRFGMDFLYGSGPSASTAVGFYF